MIVSASCCNFIRVQFSNVMWVLRAIWSSLFQKSFSCSPGMSTRPIAADFNKSRLISLAAAATQDFRASRQCYRHVARLLCFVQAEDTFQISTGAEWQACKQAGNLEHCYPGYCLEMFYVSSQNLLRGDTNYKYSKLDCIDVL